MSEWVGGWVSVVEWSEWKTPPHPPPLTPCLPEPLCEHVNPEREEHARPLDGERVTGACCVTGDEIVLEFAELVLGNAHGGEVAEARVDAVYLGLGGW